MSSVCKVCNREFDTLKGLSAHLKVHKMKAGEYYQKFYPRYSIATKELIEFEDYDQYMHSFFNGRKEMQRWFKTEGPKSSQASKVADTLLKTYLKRKGVDVIPGDFWFFLADCPPLGACKRLIKDFDKKYDAPLLTDAPPSVNLCSSFFVDTREQKPFDLSDPIFTKLEIGDYAAQGDFFDNVYVDRKGPNDFVSTFSSGFDRFCRELDRAIAHEAFLYIVVESNLKDMFRENAIFSRDHLLRLAIRNAKDLLTKHPNNIQFIFAGNRDLAKNCTVYLLSAGKEGTKYDYQYLINNGLAPWN